jgi:hypothetical protein
MRQTMNKLLLYILLFFFSFQSGFSKTDEETLFCPAPTSVVSSNVTSNSVTLAWVETGTATVWEILTLPANSPAPTADVSGWITTTVNPFLFPGLTPGTSYDIYVRADCGAELSIWSTPTTITTPVAPPVCGGNFTDQGGSTGNYPNDSNITTTICPTNPGESVVVTFTEFNTEASLDVLFVYNGFNATFSQISSSNPGGGYWGTSIPGPFISTTPNGCLTFVFTSNATNTSAGWVANVNCGPISCDVPSLGMVTNLTNTTAVLNWTNPSNATQFEVLVVPQGSPPPTFNSVGIFTQTPPFTVTGLAPDQCYTAYVRAQCSMPSEWSAPMNFCMYNCQNNGDCAESLVLVAFLDSNNNGIMDTGEASFNYGNFVYQINDSSTNYYGVTNQGTYYIFDSNPTNSYDISFLSNPDLNSFYTSALSHNNITLPDGSGANTLYFPVVDMAPHVNAQVTLLANGQPRPGFMYYNLIAYQNQGSQAIANGTLTYTHQPNVTISVISEVGATPISNGFTYNFTNLQPFETRYINVGLLVPTIPTVNLGDLVTNTASIQINNDVDTSNNSSSLTQAIVGSYDPNNKNESHGGKIVHGSFTSNDYLYYTIQFENTGSASAEFIRVEDLLDNQLDENTFEMINASHAVNTKRDGNQLIWHFYNIDLPPTSSNPTGSHGFIYFRIKPKPGYVIGDIIPNTALIYFDYNPAIVTNTFNTEFVQALGTPQFDLDITAIYPNPAKSSVQIIQNANENIRQVVFYDVAGKIIKRILGYQNSQVIDISMLEKGIYFVEITTENNIKTVKKLIAQ